MNLGIVFQTLGKVILCEGALLLLPLLVAFIYNETSSFSALIVTILICLILGGICIIKKPKSRIFFIREGFVITAMSWIIISVIGAIPFILTGVISDPISAIFETVSGFTTTGSSILSDVENLPKSILFWRSFTHWIGGMGVLVFILMLKSPNNGSSTNIMKAESPGPQVEKLVPKLQSTAMILYAIYFALTITEIILLVLGGMSLFEATTLSFGTVGTGGFGVKNTSIGGYSPYIQWIITIFMILCGINFSFYFLILQKKLKKALLIEEIRWYLFFIIASVFIIVLNLSGTYNTFGETLRHSAFQVGSIMTTTGYATVDFNSWPQASKTILVILMFIGACAGSTGGGIKVSRILV
ncbi:MAG: TrkH family potassium uptake protein, partial [Clostridia bacterium]|nr:TrkH family potassium uptake protein [Clostridia bacterium]